MLLCKKKEVIIGGQFLDYNFDKLKQTGKRNCMAVLNALNCSVSATDLVFNC